MESFLERLCSVIHWIAFLTTCGLIYIGFNPDQLLLNFSLALVPNTIGWLIKFIFTGNGKFFPF
jgi:hypothetical protein